MRARLQPFNSSAAMVAQIILHNILITCTGHEARQGRLCGHQVVEREWGTDLISSWNKHGWYTMAGRLGGKIARLIGARAGEVVVADSTSVNLFKVVSAALQLRPHRRIILSGMSWYTHTPPFPIIATSQGQGP